MLTKRTFLKGTAAALASLGSIASAQAKAVSPDTTWDKETDVLVVGFGGAGASAAISAHDAGSRVLILEKCLSRAATPLFLQADSCSQHKRLRGSTPLRSRRLLMSDHLHEQLWNTGHGHRGIQKRSF